MTNRELNWTFPDSPPLSSGFNAAGISTFSANRDSALFRECLQNSLDADDGNEAVLVEIVMEELPLNEIAKDSLSEALKKCIDSKYIDESGKQQFQVALRMLNGSSIPTLSITDLNTLGAPDYPADANEVGPWEAPTNSEGFSSKTGNKLGSFGLGKHATFASTPLRTVLYSTCYEQNGELNKRFIGRAILVKHQRDSELWNTRDGYLGDEFGPLIDQEIPERFTLSSPGTRVWIPGYRPGEDEEGRSWEERVLNAAADNFFYAIVHKRLELSIGKSIVIDENSLKKESEFWEIMHNERTKRYIEVTRSESISHYYIEGIGDLTFRIHVGEENDRRALAIVRHPGLMITDIAEHLGYANPPIPHHWHPFTAVVYCVPRDGDDVFHDCEPPSHDKLAVDEIPETDTIKRKKAKKALSQLSKWLYDEIEKYASPQGSEADSSAHELEEFGLVIEDEGSGTRVRIEPLRLLNRSPRLEAIRNKRENDLSEDEIEVEDPDGDDQPFPEEGEGTGGTQQGSSMTEKGVKQEKAKKFELSSVFRPVMNSKNERETHKLTVSFIPPVLESKKSELEIAIRAVCEDEAAHRIVLMAARSGNRALNTEENRFSVPDDLIDGVTRIEVELITNEPIGVSSFSLACVVQEAKK